MTEAMSGPLTEEALFELLSLECRVDSDGTVRYYNTQGKIHRVHGPAIEYSDGGRAWCQNGQRHRVDGPAVEYSDGGREWRQNGQLHRLDGPAIEHPDGYRAWRQHGQLHRLDGPAIEHPDGSKFWYINGNELTEAEWLQQVASMENL